MCWFGGGGSGGTPSYVPSSTQATAPNSTQANKELDQAASNQKAILANNANGSNNVLNGGMGLTDDADKRNAKLNNLGG